MFHPSLSYWIVHNSAGNMRRPELHMKEPGLNLELEADLYIYFLDGPKLLGLQSKTVMRDAPRDSVC